VDFTAAKGALNCLLRSISPPAVAVFWQYLNSLKVQEHGNSKKSDVYLEVKDLAAFAKCRRKARVPFGYSCTWLIARMNKPGE